MNRFEAQSLDASFGDMSGESTGSISQHDYGTVVLASERRMGVEGSATWSLLVDAAERIMSDQGYAAVTSRQLGKEAQLSPQIVYFYFRNMDELFEAVFKRLADSILGALEVAATSSEPILAMWEISCDPTRSTLMVELIGLSNRRKELQRQIGEFGREYNRRQVAIIDSELGKVSPDHSDIPAGAIASILENLARGIAFGKGFDISSHDMARDFVTQFLRTRFQKAPVAPGRILVDDEPKTAV